MVNQGTRKSGIGVPSYNIGIPLQEAIPFADFLYPILNIMSILVKCFSSVSSVVRAQPYDVRRNERRNR